MVARLPEAVAGSPRASNPRGEVIQKHFRREITENTLIYESPFAGLEFDLAQVVSNGKISAFPLRKNGTVVGMVVLDARTEIPVETVQPDTRRGLWKKLGKKKPATTYELVEQTPEVYVIAARSQYVVIEETKSASGSRLSLEDRQPQITMNDLGNFSVASFTPDGFARESEKTLSPESLGLSEYVLNPVTGEIDPEALPDFIASLDRPDSVLPLGTRTIDLANGGETARLLLPQLREAAHAAGANPKIADFAARAMQSTYEIVEQNRRAIAESVVKTDFTQTALTRVNILPNGLELTYTRFNPSMEQTDTKAANQTTEQAIVMHVFGRVTNDKITLRSANEQGEHLTFTYFPDGEIRISQHHRELGTIERTLEPEDEALFASARNLLNDFQTQGLQHTPNGGLLSQTVSIIEGKSDFVGFRHALAQYKDAVTKLPGARAFQKWPRTLIESRFAKRAYNTEARIFGNVQDSQLLPQDGTLQFVGMSYGDGPATMRFNILSQNKTTQVLVQVTETQGLRVTVTGNISVKTRKKQEEKTISETYIIPHADALDYRLQGFTDSEAVVLIQRGDSINSANITTAKRLLQLLGNPAGLGKLLTESPVGIKTARQTVQKTARAIEGSIRANPNEASGAPLRLFNGPSQPPVRAVEADPVDEVSAEQPSEPTEPAQGQPTGKRTVVNSGFLNAGFPGKKGNDTEGWLL